MNKKDFLISTQLGLQFALAVCIFGAAGYFIDKHFGKFPLFTVIFLILGFAAALYFVIKTAVQKGKKDD